MDVIDNIRTILHQENREVYEKLLAAKDRQIEMLENR